MSDNSGTNNAQGAENTRSRGSRIITTILRRTFRVAMEILEPGISTLLGLNEPTNVYTRINTNEEGYQGLRGLLVRMFNQFWENVDNRRANLSNQAQLIVQTSHPLGPLVQTSGSTNEHIVQTARAIGHNEHGIYLTAEMHEDTHRAVVQAIHVSGTNNTPVVLNVRITGSSHMGNTQLPQPNSDSSEMNGPRNPLAIKPRSMGGGANEKGA